MVRPLLACLALCTLGCNQDPARARGDAGGGEADLTPSVPDESPDLAQDPTLNECGDTNPTCAVTPIGPPFPLQEDPTPDPSVRNQGVARDGDGYLGLAQSRAGNDHMWIANPYDKTDTVSRMAAKTVRELSRYPTITCSSNTGGSTEQCDGSRGCCSLDDWPRYMARKQGQPQPPHQKVQLMTNHPSRTAVDINGDLYIANRAFGGQSSVTKIAASKSDCIDRNRNGKIDTSKDTNANGWIEVDCNNDGLHDDLPRVKARPCDNGLEQEYYGLDDECVLWTTNTFVDNAIGRPLALAGYGEKTDAWAGSYSNSNFVRIDGATGLCKQDTQLDKAVMPYGCTVDSSGILWTTPLGTGSIGYFDTKHPEKIGVARDPSGGRRANGYGITMDADQNIWLGSGLMRYTPDRSNGFSNLGLGWWLTVTGAGSGVGIAGDLRTPSTWFVWACEGTHILRIPGSTLKTMKVDQMVSGAGWPTVMAPCRGVGVDVEQNIWAVPSKDWVTRALVDKNGDIRQPNVGGMAAGKNVCPAGDSCRNAGAYTYSDFAGFGFRNFTAPRGTYSYVVRSTCPDQNPTWGTRWLKLVYDSDEPSNTELTVRVRSGPTPMLDMSWGQWSDPLWSSPVDLAGHSGEDHYMQVEWNFLTHEKDKSPKLKGATLFYECIFEG